MKDKWWRVKVLAWHSISTHFVAGTNMGAPTNASQVCTRVYSRNLVPLTLLMLLTHLHLWLAVHPINLS